VRIADALSAARIVLTPPIAGAILAGWGPLAGTLLVAALATDFLDGWFARRRGGPSAHGRILDPVADKILAAGVLGALLAAGRAPAELVIVVLLRDAALVSLGWLRLREGAPVPAANAWGKAAFAALGVWIAGAAVGVRWPSAATAVVGALYVAAGFSYAAALPGAFGPAAEGKR
jgi:CDP-diacylglycerol--glycerol-3-phosphate 3-phosphatidyltransferase